MADTCKLRTITQYFFRYFNSSQNFSHKCTYMNASEAQKKNSLSETKNLGKIIYNSS